MEESRELTDAELECVVGGAPRLAFLEWAANTYNDHRKEHYDKQINEKPTWAGDEYVIILVSIAIVCIAIAVQFGGKIQDLFETADSEIDTVDTNL